MICNSENCPNWPHWPRPCVNTQDVTLEWARSVLNQIEIPFSNLRVHRVDGCVDLMFETCGFKMRHLDGIAEALCTSRIDFAPPNGGSTSTYAPATMVVRDIRFLMNWTFDS